MSHYWTAADAPELRKLQMLDWLEDLAEFPAMFVSAACKEWRQNQTRRPTPAEIRKLASEAKSSWEFKNRKPPPKVAGYIPRTPLSEGISHLTPAEREENRIKCLEIAQAAIRRLRGETNSENPE